MMKLILTIIVLPLLLPPAVFSRQKADTTYYYPFVSIGYAYAVPGDVRDYYGTLVEAYRTRGLPLPTQTAFGRTLVISGGILYNAFNETRVGVSLGYWYSPAYSMYEDYAGSLSVNGSINDFDICMLAEYVPGRIGNFPINLLFRIGLCHTSSEITQEVRFNDYPQNNLDWKLTNGCWGPSFQFAVGTSMALGNTVLSMEAGYKQTKNQVQNSAIEANGVKSRLNTIMNLDRSLFYLRFSIGTIFGKAALR